MSFADVVVFDPPNWRNGEYRSEANAAEGAPDRRYVSLGCGDAHLVLRFTNSLIDVPGPDIYVFETGFRREPTNVEISIDGSPASWIEVPQARGARSGIDIRGRAAAGAEYHFVRLTNTSKSCGRRTPGADIDAVAAIGAGPLEILDSVGDAVLFAFNESRLQDNAAATLDALAVEIDRRNPVLVFVTGHTDSDGGDEFNLRLSDRRAAAVQEALATRRPGVEIISTGYGEGYPIADNNSDAGRARNRRVEILIVPRR